MMKSTPTFSEYYPTQNEAFYILLNLDDFHCFGVHTEAQKGFSFENPMAAETAY